MLIRDKQTFDLWWIFTGTDMPEAYVRVCERSTETKAFCSGLTLPFGLEVMATFIMEVRILWTCWIAWAVHSTAVKSKGKFTSISLIVYKQVMGEKKKGNFQCYLDIYSGGKMWLCSSGVKKIGNVRDNFKFGKRRCRKERLGGCYRELYKFPLDSHVIRQPG